MTSLTVCAEGHHWQPAPEEAGVPARLRCSVCGLVQEIPSVAQAVTVTLQPGEAGAEQAAPGQSLAALVSFLRQDQRRHWRGGLRIKAEAYLARFAALAADPDSAFRLIEGEIRAREELGERPGAEEYLRRFPAWADPVQSFFASRQTVAVAGTGGVDTVGDQASAAVPAPTLPAEPAPASSGQAANISVHIPGYEILEELGRGGMGVVYKARQRSLKRLVALKMVLAGPHLGHDQLERFRREAEAVAALQHPHIVQIHEIGEHCGSPYFSLELVPGGNLAGRLKEGPLPAQEAAVLLQALARAMHYCHQRGIIHRDLKPANVLLSEDGSPRITDFGLAKQLEGDMGQTRSGAIMGTPSYMAPEQAEGRVHDVGPHTDVYALGAILYELLTGRPPFRGSTLVETLEQVRLHDPLPPRRLKASVPHDLETICLKCLRKEPAGRYSSALALAQDLERWAAGESILARREGPARRLWRKVRRRPLASLSVLLMLLTMIAAGAAVWNIHQGRQQVLALTRAFDAGMEREPDEWSPEHLAGMEKLVEDLDRLAPEQSAEARPRLVRRYADVVRSWFARAGSLDADLIGRVEQGLEQLAAREPERAVLVRREFEERLQGLQMVLDVRAPFEQLETAFSAPLPKAVEGGLLSPAVAGSEGLVLSRVPCRGDAEMEVIFSYPSWGKAGKLGLVLGAGPGQRMTHAFELAPRHQSSGPFVPLSSTALEEARQKQGGNLSLQILREGARQRALVVPVEGKDLRLRASRRGDRLSFQINDQPPLQFQDAFPAPGSSEAVFGLYWPAGVRLHSCRAWRRVLPAAPSPLERGNDHYSRGEYNEALAFYRAQADSGAAPVRQEARFKVGLCLLALRRSDEAAAVLEEVTAQKGDRWPVLAAFRLWYIRLQQQRFAEADVVFDTLATRYRLQDISLLLSDDIRQSIMDAYIFTFSHLNLLKLMADPSRGRSLERIAAVQDYLFESAWDKYWTRYRLSQAYRLSGRGEEALRCLQELLRHPEVVEAVGGVNLIVEHYGWLQREQGNPAVALAEVDRWLMEAPGVYRKSALPLLLERSRLHIALGHWQEAEKDLADLRQALPARSMDYRFYSGVWLVEGFLRERRGDKDGALAAWREGLYPRWRQHVLEGRPPSPEQRVLSTENTDGTGMLQGLMLASLTGQLSDAEAEATMLAYISSIVGDSPLAGLKSAYRPPAAAVREIFRSPRGHDYARRLAYRDLPYSDYLRIPVLLFAYEVIHYDALPNKLLPEQDALLWQTVQSCFTALLSGKLGQVQLLQLALTWKGTLNILGWGSLAPVLDPSLRGPLAYFVGHRLLRRGRPEDAAGMFRTARQDAPPDSPLKRLAQAELDRLQAR